jgi:hypothetical protein
MHYNIQKKKVSIEERAESVAGPGKFGANTCEIAFQTLRPHEISVSKKIVNKMIVMKKENAQNKKNTRE